MNVVETLELAKRMIQLDDRHNEDSLNFFFQVLYDEARMMDTGKN